jgi:hypothetical protein
VRAIWAKLKSTKTIWTDGWFSFPIVGWSAIAALLFAIGLRYGSPHLSTIAGGILGGVGHLVSLGRVHQSMNPRIYRGILLDPIYAALIAWSACTILMSAVRVGWLVINPNDGVTLFALAALAGLLGDTLLDRLQKEFTEGE